MSSRQHPGLKTAEGGLIALCNHGRGLLHLCQSRGITTLAYMGVASNLGAIGRPCGIFNLTEPEVDSKATLPAFAQKHFARGFRSTFDQAIPNDGNDLPGLAALYDAGLLVLSVRRRAVPVMQMDHLERYIRSGKPLVAIRVSCVPFAAGKAPSGHVVWERFDREVLGCSGTRYTGRWQCPFLAPECQWKWGRADYVVSTRPWSPRQVPGLCGRATLPVLSAGASAARGQAAWRNLAVQAGPSSVARG